MSTQLLSYSQQQHYTDILSKMSIIRVDCESQHKHKCYNVEHNAVSCVY
jgi:hypothetical protein